MQMKTVAALAAGATLATGSCLCGAWVMLGDDLPTRPAPDAAAGPGGVPQ